MNSQQLLEQLQQRTYRVSVGGNAYGVAGRTDVIEPLKSKTRQFSAGGLFCFRRCGFSAFSDRP